MCRRAPQQQRRCCCRHLAPLHRPEVAFHSRGDLIRRAASDPKVLAIKLTIYRTGGDSPIVQLLTEAA